MTQYLMRVEAHRPYIVDVMCYGDAVRVAGMETRRTGVHHEVDQFAKFRTGPYLTTIYCDMPGKQACPVHVFEEGQQ